MDDKVVFIRPEIESEYTDLLPLEVCRAVMELHRLSEMAGLQMIMITSNDEGIPVMTKTESTNPLWAISAMECIKPVFLEEFSDRIEDADEEAEQ